jgi:hypothetical protein
VNEIRTSLVPVGPVEYKGCSKPNDSPICLGSGKPLEKKTNIDVLPIQNGDVP